MKRFVIAVCILITTVAFSIYGYFSICSRIDSVITLMQTDRELTVSQNKIEASRTKEILDEWENHETFLVSMLTHYELEEVEMGIRCLKDYMNQNLMEEYLETLNECINQLTHVKETELPDLKNIF